MLGEPKLFVLHVWRTPYLARAVHARIPGQRIPAHQIGLQIPVAWFRIPIVRVRNRRVATEVALGANGLDDRDVYVVKTLDSVLGNHPFQHCLKQSSVSLDSSDLLGALHPCLADQDSMLGKRTCKNTAVVDATITTQGLWPTSPTDPQADEAIQALSARRRTVSLSQQHYLLKSSTLVENVQAQVRFIGNVLDFQNIDAEIPTENVVFWKRYLGRLMFGFVLFTGIASKMTACLNVLGRSPSSTQNLYQNS